MDFHVENLGPCRKQVKVTISPERVLEEFDTQYSKSTTTSPCPGSARGGPPGASSRSDSGRPSAAR